MRSFRVNLTDVVKHQILEQLEYIADDSLDNALGWHDRLLLAIRQIGEHPGYAVDEEATRRLARETRKLVFEGTYLVFYQTDEAAGVVEVIGFRHGMRLPREGEA